MRGKAMYNDSRWLEFRALLCKMEKLERWVVMFYSGHLLRAGMKDLLDVKDILTETRNEMEHFFNQ